MTHEQMLNVKVGDVVCDCRFRHYKVKEIHENIVATPSLGRFFWWLPAGIYDFLYYHVWRTELVDKDLVLEDGAWCSAIHCASVVPHKWEHPTEEELQAYSR